MARRKKATRQYEPINPEGWTIRESGYWWYVYRDGEHVKVPSDLDPTYLGNALFKSKEDAEAFIVEQETL